MKASPSSPRAIAADSMTGPELDIAAPGVDIQAAAPGGGYAPSTGTSPATAIVAAIAATGAAA